MSEEWFSNPDSTSTLTVAWRREDWYVADTAVDGDVKCVLPDDISLQQSDSPYLLDVRVGKFMHAVGVGPSYLFLKRIDDAISTESKASDPPDKTTSATSNQTNGYRQTDASCSSDQTMLDKIAREKIGDEELTVSEAERDSMVGQAKKRASTQGRDPAIDPNLHPDDDDDEETDDW